ncbi:hypothetical protein KIN20_025602 [Parelaphostrongylus tenuis]|uniref:Uncharacterized protein n=1 Tax=Parelaphostrongylus tenuis TaxID=148309 RepID=A0AAD5MYN0_PARTN|nr:hypothetical protein KIN20_025602 [Parelaphostrongylus tenuis]
MLEHTGCAKVVLSEGTDGAKVGDFVGQSVEGYQANRKRNIRRTERDREDEKLSTNLPVSFNPSCVALGSLVAHGIQMEYNMRDDYISYVFNPPINGVISTGADLATFVV